MAKTMNWEEAAKFCEETFGTFVDWEERFFICPECNDVVLCEDWPNYNWSICPVCETCWEDIE